MGVMDERDPLITGNGHVGPASVGRLLLAVTAIDERAGIARVVKRAQHTPMAQRRPCQLAFVRAAANPERELQLLRSKSLHDRARRAGAGEGREQMRDGVGRTLVGIEDDLARRVGHEPDRQGHGELAATSLGELAAAGGRG